MSAMIRSRRMVSALASAWPPAEATYSSKDPIALSGSRRRSGRFVINCPLRTGVVSGHLPSFAGPALEHGRLGQLHTVWRGVALVALIRSLPENRNSVTGTSVSSNVTNRLFQNWQFIVRFELGTTETKQ